MLGKLIKHEFKATGKIFGLLYSATVVLTLFSMFCIYIPFDNIVIDILTGLVTIACVVCIFGGFVFSLIILIRRFYTNMLKDEGYLTHTLPVKKWQLIVSKLVTDYVWILASFLVSVISLFIVVVGSGELDELLKSLNVFFKVIGDYPRLIGYIIGFSIICSLQFFANMLGVFAAMSIGQIFSKHKVLASVVAYFILIYAVMALFSTFMALLPNVADWMNNVDIRLENAKTFEQCLNVFDDVIVRFMLVAAVAELVMGGIYFAITNYMLSKKLNLE